jgi:O-antigen ligase
LGVGSLLSSASRASIGGLLFGAIVAMMIHYRSRLIIIIGIALALIIIGIVPVRSAIQSGFIKGIVREKTLKTYGGREEIWQLGWTLFKKRPILGYGFGTTEVIIATKGDPANTRGLSRWGKQSHNSLLRSILESGIIGTVFIVIFFITYPLTLIRVLMKAKSKELYSLLLMFTVFSTGALFNSFFEAWLLSVGSVLAFVFWWSVAMVYKIQLHPEDYVMPDDTPQEVL